MRRIQVGEAPSPDDNPGVNLVVALGVEPSPRSYLELRWI